MRGRKGRQKAASGGDGSDASTDPRAAEARVGGDRSGDDTGMVASVNGIVCGNGPGSLTISAAALGNRSFSD